MAVCQQSSILPSPAQQRLDQFVRAREQAWGTAGIPELPSFEVALHEYVQGLERELLAAELARYDVQAERVVVSGVTYQRDLHSPETYLSAAGPVCVERYLYRAAGRNGPTICPLELQAGIIAGYFTPNAARQAAYVTAQLPPGESATLFGELGHMRPSRASLDRLPKQLSGTWESQRVEWEATVRASESLPAVAAVVAISVDGVMLAMRAGAAQRQAKAAEAGKHASGPTGHQEVGCGTVVLYDADGERVQTVRYARMPESKKPTLEAQITAEMARVVMVRPELRRVYLADGAKDNWRLLAAVEAQLPAPIQPSTWIADYYHACDHLKEACDAIWGESTARSQAEFERLKTALKTDAQGVTRVIRVLIYRRRLARGTRRTRVQAALRYFRNQRPHMAYAAYVREGLPIASGVVEASCKTLVTQRLKRSGMAWAPMGGQAILTLRSLIQSGRWPAAWSLLSAAYRQTVQIVPAATDRKPVAPQPAIDPRRAKFNALPLAV